MNILILGAAGQVARLLEAKLLRQTGAYLVLYARNAHRRLKVLAPAREKLVDSDFHDTEALIKAMQGVDLVYINDMGDKTATSAIASAMERSGVKRVIAASILGIHDEVPGAFGQWNEKMVGKRGIQKQKESAAILEQSSLTYTLLRLTWLYNQNDNDRYMLTFKGEPFVGAQVTRQAVAQLVVDIIQDDSDRFIRASVGVSEPDTDWDKPSFY